MTTDRTDHEILHSAARSLGRVDIGGPRAVTMEAPQPSWRSIGDIAAALVRKAAENE